MSLNKLFRKGELDRLEFEEEQLRSFHVFIEALSLLPVLALPQRGFPYSNDTNACNYEIGCSFPNAS